MRNKLIPSTVALIFFLGLPTNVSSQEKKEDVIADGKEIEVKVAYCNLQLSEGWKLGNLTFNSLYSFRINGEGNVVDLKKIRDDFIGIEVVSSCVSKWKIKGVPTKSPFVVSFQWKHGKGWVEQRFSGNGFTHVMTFADVGLK